MPSTHDLEGSKEPTSKCCTKKVILWTVCGVVTALLILGLVIGGIFIGGASMAQVAVDKSLITFDLMHIKGETTEFCPETAEFCLNTTMQFNIINTFPIEANMGEFPAKMSYDGSEFGYVMMPPLSLASSAMAKFTEDLVMVVTDVHAYVTFSQGLLTEKDVVTRMFGELGVTSMGLTFDVVMDKYISLAGFNGFSDPAPILKSIDFYEPSDVEVKEYVDDVEGVSGAIFAVAVNLLPNPSIIAVDSVGKITGDLFFKGVKVGTGMALSDVAIAIGDANVLELSTVLQKTEENDDVMRELMSNYVNGLETTINLVGTGSTDPLWNDAVKAMTSDVIMSGLAKDEEKQFQVINVETITTLGYMTDADNIDHEYCEPLVNNYTGSVKSAGRLSMNQVHLRNPFGMPMNVTKYDFTIQLEVEDETEESGIRIENFARVAQRPNHADQQFIYLDSLSNKIQPLTACVYDPVITGSFLPFATVGPATVLLHDTAFKQLSEVYGDDGYYKNSKPGALAAPLSQVKSNGHNVVQMAVTLTGYQSVSQPKGRFLLEDIPVVQSHVPVMARFRGVAEKND